MAAQGGFHRAFADVTGLDVEEVVFLLRPPGKAIARLGFSLILKRFDPQEHVDPQDLIVGEKILPA